MEVIPAIDLLDGKAVRLLKGRYEDVTVYHDNPPVLAAGWAGHVKRLHLGYCEVHDMPPSRYAWHSSAILNRPPSDGSGV